ncbi:MAG: hypothetical protein Q9187_000880 [Circinaria calcarea]
MLAISDDKIMDAVQDMDGVKDMDTVQGMNAVKDGDAVQDMDAVKDVDAVQDMDGIKNMDGVKDMDIIQGMNAVKDVDAVKNMDIENMVDVEDKKSVKNMYWKETLTASNRKYLKNRDLLMSIVVAEETVVRPTGESVLNPRNYGRKRAGPLSLDKIPMQCSPPPVNGPGSNRLAQPITTMRSATLATWLGKA